MEDSHYDIGKRYAEILEVMWFTFLYSTLIPFGAFLSLPGLVLYYVVDKYNLLRRSSIHGNISEKLSGWSMTLLELTLVFRPIGELIFDSHLRSATHPISFVFLITGILYMLVPWNYFLRKVTQEKFKLNPKKFQDVRYKFTETYHTMHPIYKELYLKEHLRKRNLTMGIIFPSGREVARSDVRINGGDYVEEN